MSPRRCKDCPPDAPVRPAPNPGPRCATHHRVFKKAAKDRAHEARVGRVYGLLPGQYEELKYIQRGLCAICRKATGASKRLAVDHDHDTGEVRGLLCKTCNHDLLGKYSIEALQRAIGYLKTPPAWMMVDRGLWDSIPRVGGGENE